MRHTWLKRVWGFVLTAGLVSPTPNASLLKAVSTAIQSPPGPNLQFEVVSIKPNNSGIPRMIVGGPGGCHGTDDQNRSGVSPGKCLFKNISTKELINLVYGILNQEPVQVLEEPKWLESARFDIEAKAEHPVTQKELLLMLQSTLSDRFKLGAHRENREQAGFALVVGKNGSRLTPTADKTSRPSVSVASRAETQTARITGHNASMAELAGRLQRGREQGPDERVGLGRPIVDKTGLTGTFDFTLQWSDSDGPSLFTALQEQLGLKLEPQKVSTGVLVIDHIEKPVLN